MKKILQVSGMRCSSCEMLVTEALEALDGVETAQVSHQLGQVDDEAMKKAIEGDGGGG